MAVRVLETEYAGVRFRSPLEARWAVYFDAIGFRWEYEPEGFMLQGGAYLPDFRIEGTRYAEVKPPSDAFDKAREFSRELHAPVWLCEGEPSARIRVGLHDGGEVVLPLGREGHRAALAAKSFRFWDPGPERIGKALERALRRG